MRLSISNIGWPKEQDERVYSIMKKSGFDGLEIAPTRIFPQNPYEQLSSARIWAKNLKRNWDLQISSMQSIWFGRLERLFGSEQERGTLMNYTKKAVDFASIIGCKNLVFGCPGNRIIPADADPEVGIRFFKEAGDYAAQRGTVIGMEANPQLYHTNYINHTLEAVRLIKQVDSKGFLLNLDVGTMIQNREEVSELKEYIHLIHHVHISEPGLKPIKARSIHWELKELLKAGSYDGFISVEMGKSEDILLIEEEMYYVGDIYR